MKNFDVIFDNGGGTTLQTHRYCHHYSSPEQAAKDVLLLLRGDGNTADWDGDEPEHREEYDSEIERNGGWRWMSRREIEAILQRGRLDTSWGNQRDFFGALGVGVEVE